MEPPPRPAAGGRGTCSGSHRGCAEPLTLVLHRWPRSAPGGGGAGGAGRRASELLWEGRARRSGHAWGGAARLEPPLQRRVGARKVCSIGRSAKFYQEPICCHDAGAGGECGWWAFGEPSWCWRPYRAQRGTMESFKGALCVVTGGGSGMGRELCLQ